MASKVELVGGNFQDLTGNPLNLGYIQMKLSSDEEVNDSLICSGFVIKITLDSTGNCVAGQFVWGNDVMLPVNSFYKVTVYSAAGQIVWGPNNQQVAGVGPFDVGTWIPNNVISWVPPLQPLSLQVNGAPNASQTLLNFVNSGTVTFSNVGGNVSATATVVVPPRVSALFYTIDGGGAVVSSGEKGQLSIPVNCTITGWVLTADQSGSAVVDVLRSTYGAFPTTSSIASTDKPTLTSVQKNENLAVSVWTTSLNAGDQLQFSVTSATMVQRLNLTLNITIP